MTGARFCTHRGFIAKILSSIFVHYLWTSAREGSGAALSDQGKTKQQVVAFHIHITNAVLVRTDRKGIKS